MLKEMVDTKCLTNFQYKVILISFFNEFLKIHSAQEKKKLCEDDITTEDLCYY